MILAPTLTLSAGSGAAIVRPTFSRDFAGEKTLNNGTGPAITFTRASNATFFDASGVLQTAANDAPRFDHDPATGASRGLLIEEARTNLLERSAEFDNAYWGKIDAAVVANAATSPASTLTADRVHPSTNSAASVLVRNVAASASTAYSASVFVKAAGKTFGFLQINFNQSSTPIRAFAFTIDLSSGTLGAQQDLVGATTGVTATATSVGSGWYRLSVSFTTTALTDEIAFLPGPCDAANSRTVTASGTDGIFAWGAQLEAGAFPTSYIPTTTAAATRSADSAVVTPISGFYNQAEGTLFAEVRENGIDVLYGAASLDTDTSDNRIDIRRSNDAANVSFFVSNAGASQAQIFRSLTAAAQTYKGAVAYRADDIAAVSNGGAAGTDTSATLPTLTHLRIGGLSLVSPATGNGFHLNGHIRKIAYYPKRLSNALLQQLTT